MSSVTLTLPLKGFFVPRGNVLVKVEKNQASSFPGNEHGFFSILVFFFSCFILSFASKQSSACAITTLSSLATQTSKRKYFVFPKKNNLLGNKKNPVTVFSVKNRKKIVGRESFDDPHYQITGNGQCTDAGPHSDEALGPAGLEPSEPRECSKLNPSRQTDAVLEDFTPDFENEADGEKEGLNHGCYRNGNRVHENQEEKEEITEYAQGNLEKMSDKCPLDPEEPVRGEIENAEVNDDVNPYPKENTETENDPEGIRLSQTSSEEIAQVWYQRQPFVSRDRWYDNK
ncbi:uncharacterized protein [Petaurus breviceps papuanus]|uniref:uncharacterized protein n=1 Tax=Petaurus breviceps papuanus TaxID=3040969 RepID=UPI0036DD088F